MTTESVLNEVRQRLGPLNEQAEEAVAEALSIVRGKRQLPFGLRSAEAFTSKNANLQQYLSWTDDQQERYHEEAERANADWVEKKLRELNALWLIVIDGQIIAHGPALRTFPHEEEFDALCDEIGGRKWPE